MGIIRTGIFNKGAREVFCTLWFSSRYTQKRSMGQKYLFTADLRSGPFTYSVESVVDGHLEMETLQSFPIEMQARNRLFGVIPLGSIQNQAYNVQNQVELAFDTQKLHRYLQGNASIKDIYSFNVHVRPSDVGSSGDNQPTPASNLYGEEYYRGFLFSVGSETFNCTSVIENTGSKASLVVSLDGESGSWVQQSELYSQKSNVGQWMDCSQQGRIVQEETPAVLPCFQRSQWNSSFVSLEQVMAFLRQCQDCDGVKELIEIAEKCQVAPSNRAEIPNPFVLIEGLDGVGKSTLVESVSKELNAVRARTPPNSISHLRKKFDAHPALIRRAYYMIGNYLEGQFISNSIVDKPVIMDRFWPSTAAYTIATECGSGSGTVVPPTGHDVYQWPNDLIKPSLCIVLEAEEETRRHRITTRQEGVTEEEQRLVKEANFRDRISAAYGNMSWPGLHFVTANQEKEKVLSDTLNFLKSTMEVP